MKVAIVGSAPSTWELAPYDDESWEVWGIASHGDMYPSVDLLFEVHEPGVGYQKSDPTYPQKVAAFAEKQNVRLVTNAQFPCPREGDIVFPHDDAERLMGQPYLTSSIAYMLAYAVLQEVDEIGIYGVEMAVDSEAYFHQANCVNAWIGFAKGMGIRITIPDRSVLFKASYVYGVQDEPVGGVFSEKALREMAQKHTSAIEKIENEIQTWQKQIAAHRGALQAFEALGNVARAVEAGHEIQSLQDSIELK